MRELSRLAGSKLAESVVMRCVSSLHDGETVRRAHGDDTDNSSSRSDSGSRQAAQCSLSNAVDLLLTRETDDDEIRSGASVEDGEEGRSFGCWREKNES